MSGSVIVGLGEVLWDLFPDGPRFGGAPANFACHAAALGADSRMVSSVGADPLGADALNALRARGVATDCVSELADFPTGTVQVTLDGRGQASYEFAADAAWDHLPWSDAVGQLATQTEAVCFGSLGQRGPAARSTIQRFLAAMPAASLRVLDINLRPPFYDDQVILNALQAANVLKLNDEELPIVADVCGLHGDDLPQQLGQRFQLQAVAVTRGSRGALLYRGERVWEQEGLPVRVQDTVGAGDSYTAALVLGLLAQLPPAKVNRVACEVAAYVCGQPGATPELPKRFANQLAT